jgi:hypothetical protein
VDKPDRPKMPNYAISETSRAPNATHGPRNSLDRRIRAFLNGESHGEDVLGALYRHVAEEPIPERLRGLLKN